MPGSLTRFGPTKRDGDARFDHTGSTRMFNLRSELESWRGRHMKCARPYLRSVPAGDLYMAMVPRPATLPSCHASDDRQTRATDHACFLRVRHADRKTVRRRSDRRWDPRNNVAACFSESPGGAYRVSHSVEAPRRVRRAVFPLIQNSVLPRAYLPPSADETCGSTTGRSLPANVSRTKPCGVGASKTAFAEVPSAHR
jgi:hypothetical protein